MPKSRLLTARRYLEPKLFHACVGSLTEKRAQKASQHINKEMLTLVSVIRGIGEKDKTNPDIVRVKFGKLFEFYTGISNKVSSFCKMKRDSTAI